MWARRDQGNGRPRRLRGLPAIELLGERFPLAVSTPSRVLGLALLDREQAGPGLVIPRCRSVHTFTMRFPLDLIWLSKDGEPVRVDRAVAPRRLKFCFKARSVVEANAGAADAFVAGLKG